MKQHKKNKGYLFCDKNGHIYKHCVKSAFLNMVFSEVNFCFSTWKHLVIRFWASKHSMMVKDTSL